MSYRLWLAPVPLSVRVYVLYYCVFGDFFMKLRLVECKKLIDCLQISILILSELNRIN